MLFSSVIFLFYFLPVVLLVYYALFWSRRIQNLWLFLMSIFFYAWGEPVYVAVIILSIIFNYIIGWMISSVPNEKRKVYLTIGVFVNLLVLFCFKYLNFFIRNFNESLEADFELPLVPLVLPIGISFFTFQAISYLVDVFRARVEAQKNLIHMGLYISFFPQLIAGPIVRYETIAAQITGRRESLIKLSSGSTRFIIGLSKKLLIANQMAVIADHIFLMQARQDIPLGLAWFGAIVYTLQIYYDFSGYSDMAIGLSSMFGFTLCENFHYPYISASISEFWRRWHTSLGIWFREYVYIPLGGSRVKNHDYLVRNLFIVWLLTGIWHGNEWTFWIWGVYNGLFVVIEKLTHFEQWNKGKIFRHIYTMFVVMIGWVMFRSNDLVQAGRYIGNMFSIRFGVHSPIADMFFRENVVFILAAVIFAFPVAGNVRAWVEKKNDTWVLSAFYPFLLLGLFLVCISYMLKGTYHPFIYFNF